MDADTERLLARNREASRTLALEYDRYAIIMAGDEHSLYFCDEMDMDEQRAMKRYLVHLGRATWLWPDLR